MRAPVLSLYIWVVFILALCTLVASCAVTPAPEPPQNKNPEPEPMIIEKPTLSEVEVHEITRISAIVIGEVRSSGGDSIISKGIIYRTGNGGDITVNSTNKEGLYFMINLSELDGDTEYFIKSFAENSAGKSYSEELKFKTEPYTAPELKINKTVATEDVFTTTVECAISDDGGKEIQEKGICWSTSPDPVISNNKMVSKSGSSAFKSILKGLQGNTTYYLRGYAINELGVNYSETVVMVVDIDGNVYNTVKIGNQRWTVENLKVTRLNNGVEIKNVTDNEEWSPPMVVTSDPDYKTLEYPKYCWYDNDEKYKKDYGGLYNWYAASAGNLAPKGWRIPSYGDFVEFIRFLDPDAIKEIYPKAYGDSLDYVQYKSQTLGSKIKAKHFSDMWNGSDETGFSSIPAGWRQGGGEFDYLGVKREMSKFPAPSAGYWCTSDIYIEDVVEAIAYWLLVSPSPGGNIILWFGGKRQGFSIRCIMD